MPYPRTVGDYACYWNGEEVAGLNGQIVERDGPGDSTNVGKAKHSRIREGSYRLAIQDGGKYRTFGYSAGRALPKPGILLQKQDTGERSGVVIHPGFNYLSSIGCLNPASNLQNANSIVDFKDSRARVINIIDAMKARIGAHFPKRGGATIPNAIIIIQGEPS